MYRYSLANIDRQMNSVHHFIELSFLFFLDGDNISIEPTKTARFFKSKHFALPSSIPLILILLKNSF